MSPEVFLSGMAESILVPLLSGGAGTPVPMTASLIKGWADAVAGILGIGTALFGLAKFFADRQKERDQRRQELGWKRAEFLFRLAKEFDEDQKAQECFKMFDYIDCGGPYSSTVLDHALRSQPSYAPDEIELRIRLEYMLRFFSRLDYCRETGTLTLEEVSQYAWYLRKIRKTPGAVQYCQENGFQGVLDLAIAVENNSIAKQWKAFGFKSPPPSCEMLDQAAARAGEKTSTGSETSIGKAVNA